MNLCEQGLKTEFKTRSRSSTASCRRVRRQRDACVAHGTHIQAVARINILTQHKQRCAICTHLEGHDEAVAQHGGNVCVAHVLTFGQEHTILVHSMYINVSHTLKKDAMRSWRSATYVLPMAVTFKQ